MDFQIIKLFFLVFVQANSIFPFYLMNALKLWKFYFEDILPNLLNISKLFLILAKIKKK
jgi:hypothetical protein